MVPLIDRLKILTQPCGHQANGSSKMQRQMTLSGQERLETGVGDDCVATGVSNMQPVV